MTALPVSLGFAVMFALVLGKGDQLAPAWYRVVRS
jgi:hypothetical protein